MKRLYVMVTMDWEGTDLYSHNLNAIKLFRQKHSFSMIHYLNAAYYTHPEIKAQGKISQKIWSVLKPQDHHGLHLHTPKHFVQAARVNFRNAPKFSYNSQYWGVMEGQEVMLHAYQDHEIKKLLQFAKFILQHEGFTHLTSFRAGGWMNTADIMDVLVEEGFSYDSSATTPELLQGTCWQGDNLHRYLEVLWSEIQIDTTPYFTPTGSGHLLEVPNNLSSIDYWDERKIEKMVSISVDRAAHYKTHLININSHQETAYKHLAKLDYFLERLSKECGQEGVEIVFISQPEDFLSQINGQHQEQRAANYF